MADLRAGLHPDLLAKLDTVLDRMSKAGHPMKICQGLRTVDYQLSLYAQGRTTPGPHASTAKPLGDTITDCDGLHVRSNHQAHTDGFGHAADCCFLGPDPFGPTQPWATFGAIAEAQGLRWGGRFKRVDLDHVEMSDMPLPAHAA